MKRRNETPQRESKFKPGRARSNDFDADDSPKPESKPKRPAKVRPLNLRIIGGEMRGRTVQYHGADFTRPMKDSVRENLFNILGKTVRGTICFDLFAGTAALAFESLSRGAQSAIAVEQSRTAARYIRQTADSLGIGERLTVHIGDAFRWAPRLLAPPQNDTPWIVMLAPPYVLWDESLDALNNIIRMTLRNAPPGSMVVAETDKRFDPEKLLPGDWDLRRYGGTQLGILEATNCCGMQP